jgi:hypothetical protein
MTDKDNTTKPELSPCPFCGEIPAYPDGMGTQFEIWSDCGMAISSVQICDLMTIEERLADPFTNYRYKQKYIDRAAVEAGNNWNCRA